MTPNEVKQQDWGHDWVREDQCIYRVCAHCGISFNWNVEDTPCPIRIARAIERAKVEGKINGLNLARNYWHPNNSRFQQVCILEITRLRVQLET